MFISWIKVEILYVVPNNLATLWISNLQEDIWMLRSLDKSSGGSIPEQPEQKLFEALKSAWKNKLYKFLIITDNKGFVFV